MTEHEKVELIKELMDTVSDVFEYDNDKAIIATMDFAHDFVTKICEWETEK